jgi:nucleoid DNA-binding protein
MTINKKDISKVISDNTQIPLDISLDILNTFIEIIKNNSKSKAIKISSFGSFHQKKSASRMGRNPMTKEKYRITERTKLNFKCSNKIRRILN